ncbi:MAG: GNAT family N-acetyltransferase [Chitinophagaceae bacterium]
MIELIPFTEAHYDQLIGWITTEEELVQFAGLSLQYPLTKEQLQRSAAEPNRLSYSVSYLPENKIVGHAEIVFPDPATAFIYRVLIGDQSNRGKGIGFALINQLLDIAFSNEVVKETSLNVFDWNTPAIKCYLKAGFHVNEGKIKTLQVNNQQWTALNMSCFRETRK